MMTIEKPAIRDRNRVFLTASDHSRLFDLATRTGEPAGHIVREWLIRGITAAARSGTVDCKFCNVPFLGRRSIEFRLTIEEWRSWRFVAARLGVSEQKLAYSILRDNLDRADRCDKVT